MPAANQPLRSVVLYSADPWESVLPWLRVRGPAAINGVRVIQGNQGDKVAPESVADADLVVIQRDFARFWEAYRQIVALARAAGKPLVYELDDLLFDLPEGHLAAPAYTDQLFAVLAALVECDQVVVTTPPLAARVGPLNPNVAVVPNYLDDQLWPLAGRPDRPASAAPVTVGYMGGPTHQPDLESVAAGLLHLLDRRGRQVRLHFWGASPPPALRDRPQVAWTPLDQIDYAEFARQFAAQTADIFIAPLCDNAFNRCKSAIKFLEYSALGMPGVYSRLEPYTAVVRSGENGLLASTPAEWEAALDQLVASPALRQKLGAGAQATVRDHWRLSEGAGDWLAAYQKVLASGARPALSTDQRAMFLRVAEQVQPRHRALEAYVWSLRAEVKRLEGVDRELAEIRASLAWRVALALTRWRAHLAPDGSRRKRFLDAVVHRTLVS